MNTRIIRVDNKSPEQYKIQEIAGILRAGGIAGVPTETVFGLACNGQDNSTIKRIYDIKNRPAGKSLVIQIASIGKLAGYKVDTTPEINNILQKFWPGPLTVILNSKNGKTGFRIPDNKVMLSIIQQSDFPLAVTSANISGEKALFCAEDVKKVFDGKIDIVVDDKTQPTGIASTVIDCTQVPFKILRRGAFAEEIKKLI